MPGLSTFGDVWRMVRLHAPDAPFGLVRNWTQDAYASLHERRPWLWAMKEARLSTLASRTLTVTFTTGSRDITSAAGFLSTDVGRQIRVTDLPIYTINEVTDASNAVLDLAYAETGGAETATILSAYATLPEDFGAFMTVLDTTNQRQIGYWYTQADLAACDPGRTNVGTPQRALVATTESTAPTLLGRTRYEWWPTPTAAGTWPIWYRTRPPQLADTDPFKGVLATRGDILVAAALANCALWPGTSDKPNPYFSVAVHRQFKDQFEADCARLELRDDDQAQQSWVAAPWHQWPVWSLYGDTQSLRNHDATIYDYW